MIKESHCMNVGSAGGSRRIHLKRIYVDPEGPPVLLLHGAIENGRMFYSNSGKGLAPFLARAGYDCYVADLPGRGESKPRIRRGSSFGQTETITEDIPAMADYIRSLRPGVRQRWIAHSWGGVMMASTLVRFPEYIPLVDCLVFFGTKRTVRTQGPARWLYIDLVWNRLCPLLAGVFGYLPAGKIGIGSDSETRSSLLQSIEWVKPSPWVDPGDGFSYAEAAQWVQLPPAWFLAGGDDPVLGNPADVRDFAAETGIPSFRFTLLSRSRGYSLDYDHINMLTHPAAVKEIFPEVAGWIKGREGGFRDSWRRRGDVGGDSC